MADIKVIYKNADGFDQEHSESSDSIKMFSLKTSGYELTNEKLGNLIGGNDIGTLEHNHDSLYFRESEFINASTGASDAAKPVKTNASGLVDSSFIDATALESALNHDNLVGVANSTAHTKFSMLDGTRDFTGVVKYSSQPTFTDDKQLITKKYADDLVSGLESKSVLDLVATPPSSPATGDMYLVAHSGTSGSFVGHEDAIATWNGSAWVYATPTVGLHVYIDTKPNEIYLWSGSVYSVKTYETTTASGGLQKTGADISIDPASAGAALAFASGVYDVQVDDIGIEVALDKLQLKAAGVKASKIDFGTGAGQVSGASVPIADVGSYFPTKNVEAALQKLAADVVATGVDYLAGVGGITKGDACYISDYNTISKFSSLSSNARIIGVALNTVAEGGTVKVLANDTVCDNIISGGVAGATYYLGAGGTLTTTIPSGSGSHVWKIGQAKDSNSLHIEVDFIKKNS